MGALKAFLEMISWKALESHLYPPALAQDSFDYLTALLEAAIPVIVKLKVCIIIFGII